MTPEAAIIGSLMSAVLRTSSSLLAMSTKIHYLAYGSNLHPLRLAQRVASAVLMATVEINGQQLVFNKLGRDGSAKCSLMATRDSRTSAWAALFAMDRADVGLLDQHEGLGRGYDRCVCRVRLAGVELPAFAYLAADSHRTDEALPYLWYRDVVVLGARYHGFPDHYVNAIADRPAVADPNADRADLGAQLLADAERYSSQKPRRNPGAAATVVDWPVSPPV